MELRKKLLSVVALAFAMALSAGVAVSASAQDAAPAFAITDTAVRISETMKDDNGTERNTSGLRFKTVTPSDKTAYTEAYTILTVAGIEGEKKVNANVWRNEVDNGWNTVLMDIDPAYYTAEVTAQSFLVEADGDVLQTNIAKTSIAKTASFALNLGETAEKLNTYTAGVVTDITLSNETAQAVLGDVIQLTATTTPVGYGVVWASDNAEVATVDNTGKVTAVGFGTANISATMSGVSKTFTITVAPTNPIAPASGFIVGDDLLSSYAAGISDGKDIRTMENDAKYGKVLKWVSNSSTMYNPRIYFKNTTDAAKYDYVKLTLKVVPHEGYENVMNSARIGLNENAGNTTKENGGATYADDLAEWTTITFDAIDNASAFTNFETKGIALTTHNEGRQKFYCDVYVAAVECGYYDLDLTPPDRTVTYDAATLKKSSAAAGISSECVAAGGAKDVQTLVTDDTYGTVLKWTGGSGASSYFAPRLNLKNVNATAFDYVKFTVKLVPYAGFEETAKGIKIWLNEDRGQTTYENGGTTYADDLAEWTTIRFDAINNAAAFEQSADSSKGVVFTVRCNARFDFDVYIAKVELGYYNAENPAPAYQPTVYDAATLNSNAVAGGQLAAGASAGRDVRVLEDDATYGKVIKWTSSGGNGFDNPRLFFNDIKGSFVNDFDYIQFTVKIVPIGETSQANASSLQVCMNRQTSSVSKEFGKTYISNCAEWTTLTFDKADNAASFEHAVTNGLCFNFYANKVIDCYVYIAKVEMGVYQTVEEDVVEPIDLTAKYVGLTTATFKAEGASEAVAITDLTAWMPAKGQLTITLSKEGCVDRVVTLNVLM